MKKNRFKVIVSVVVLVAVLCSFSFSTFAAEYITGNELWGLGYQNLSMDTPFFPVYSGTLTCKLYLGPSDTNMYVNLYNSSNQVVPPGKTIIPNVTQINLVWFNLDPTQTYHLKFYFYSRQSQDKYCDVSLYDGYQS